MATENVGKGGGGDILTQVGDLARREQKDDARFERVARGEASAEELAALETDAKNDAELAIRLEASRPLDADVAERIASRVTTARRTSSAGEGGEKKASPAVLEAKAPPQEKQAETEKKPAQVLRPTFGRRLVTIAGPLALAAALVLYITTSRGPEGPEGPELPNYVVSASGEQAMRGAAPSDGAGATRLHLSAASKNRDARFEIVLRPATTAPVGKIVAYAFTATSKEIEAAPLDAKIEIAPEGSVRISGPARLLDGASEIRVVLGAPAAIGKFDDAAQRAARRKSNEKHVHVLSIAIDRD